MNRAGTAYLARVRDELDRLAAQSLRRELRRAVPPGALDFASNDYLGLARDPRVIAALAATSQVGSGGSRLLSGAHEAHAVLEDTLARWTRRERALLFSSGYLAAGGAIGALAPFVSHVYSDAANHACAIDAIRLTRLPRTIYAHGALPARDTRATPAMIVTESIFGMSGARNDIGALLASLADGDILVVDEAHALGVAGPCGAGACAEFDDPRIVIVGTLSKALGGAGGFVAGADDAIAYLATAARTFVFDTAPPPALANAAATAVAIARGTEGDALRARLAANAASLRAELDAHGIARGGGDGAIVPLHVGAPGAAFAIGRDLASRGIFAPAIRPPTVPPGQSQIRVTVRADHTRDDVRAFADAYAALRLART